MRLATMDLRVVYFFVVLGLVQSELIDLKCDGIKKFVNGHNTRRAELAKGNIPGQPAALKMKYMVWNDELAEKAAKWAARNKYAHNPDRSIPSKQFGVGENIYIYSTTESNFQFDPDMAMSKWFDEHNDFQYRKLDSSDFRSQLKIGHYTQMAWSDTEHLGCAISYYKKNKFHNYLVVCDYGPAGNIIGKAPYKSGQGSGSLTCGASNCQEPYGSFCRG